MSQYLSRAELGFGFGPETEKIDIGLLGAGDADRVPLKVNLEYDSISAPWPDLMKSKEITFQEVPTSPARRSSSTNTYLPTACLPDPHTTTDRTENDLPPRWPAASGPRQETSLPLPQQPDLELGRAKLIGEAPLHAFGGLTSALGGA